MPTVPDQVNFPTLGNLVADWIEWHCRVPDGPMIRQNFTLYPEQLRFVAHHYRVKPSATPDQLGPAFYYRRSQIVRPQKWGKSPLIAAFTCAEGVGPVLFDGWAVGGEVYDCRDFGCGCGFEYEYEPGEPMGRPWEKALIQITATSSDQTDNTYDALRPMIDFGPLSELIPKTGEEFIRLPDGGEIGVVTSSAKSRLGQRVSFVPQDETGLWTDTSGMTKVARTQRRGASAFGGRVIETTNAWDPSENSVAQQTFESRAADVYRDFREPPKSLGSYTNKRDRRRIHTYAYGDSLRERGGHVDLDNIEAEAAEVIEKDPAEVERFYGNRIVHGMGSWLKGDLWERTETDLVVADGGEAVALGFDGSESNDWTAIRAETRGGHRFTPTYGPDARPTVWDPAQWGGSIPRGEVNAAVDELFTRYRVARFYCDPRDWQSEIGEWALRHGDDVVKEWATYRVVQMHDALERAVTDLTTGRSTHDGCPITAAHVANARKIARPGQRYILGKPNEHQKIDAAMADVLSHEAASDAREAGWTDARENLVYIY